MGQLVKGIGLPTLNQSKEVYMWSLNNIPLILLVLTPSQATKYCPFNITDIKRTDNVSVEITYTPPTLSM